MLASLLLSLPALSDSPHRHLQNNQPDNNGGRAIYTRKERPHTLTSGEPMKVTLQPSHVSRETTVIYISSGSSDCGVVFFCSRVTVDQIWSNHLHTVLMKQINKSVFFLILTFIVNYLVMNI